MVNLQKHIEEGSYAEGRGTDLLHVQVASASSPPEEASHKGIQTPPEKESLNSC